MSDLPEPTCIDCISFQPDSFDEDERILGTCRFRPELGLIPETLPWCDSFQVKTSRQGKVALPTKKKAAGARRTAHASNDGPYKHVRGTLRKPVTGDTTGDITVDRQGLKQVIREILEEETMYGYPDLAPKYHGGALLLQPTDRALQPKELPIDAFFHKMVMLRDRLRVLEQKINTHSKLDEGDRVELQAYISKCYGTLTTFNALFRNNSDQFKS